MQTPETTPKLGLNRWRGIDPLNTRQFTEDNRLIDVAYGRLDEKIDTVNNTLQDNIDDQIPRDNIAAATGGVLPLARGGTGNTVGAQDSPIITIATTADWDNFIATVPPNSTRDVIVNFEAGTVTNPILGETAPTGWCWVQLRRHNTTLANFTVRVTRWGASNPGAAQHIWMGTGPANTFREHVHPDVAYRYLMSNPFLFNGLGHVTWNGTHINWVGRLLTAPIDATINSGRHTGFNPPANGTVITGLPGSNTPNVTVTAAGVPISGLTMLIFRHTIGGNQTAGTWHVVTWAAALPANIFRPNDIIVAQRGDGGWIRVCGEIYPEPWRVPTFVNGWGTTTWTEANHSLRFRREHNGMVRIRGLVLCPNPVGTAANGIFTLPVGFRPGYSVHFGTIGNATGAARGLLINTAGLVSIAAPQAGVWYPIECTYQVAS